jgi:hypothetical protein
MIMAGEFQPQYTEKALEGYLALYSKQPFLFTPEKVDAMEKHSEFYGKSFNRNTTAEETTIGTITKNLATGWLSGFTTLPNSSNPQTPWNKIAQSVGHLAGFVGYLPAKPLSLLAMATKSGPSVFANAAKGLRNNSVPMMLATKAQKAVAPRLESLLTKGLTAESQALKTASDFLLRDVPKSVAGGAFHLGAASAVSSWTEGIDAMVSSGLHGAAMGGVFKLIGEGINTAGITSDVAGVPLTGGQQMDIGLRALAGSLVSGLPSTLADQTTEEQVYNYLLGAWFGFNEKPTLQHKRNKAMMDIRLEAENNAEAQSNIMSMPEVYSKVYEGLDKTLKDEVSKEWTYMYGSKEEQTRISERLAQDAELEALKVAQEFREEQGYDFVDIPAIDMLNKMSIEQVTEKFTEYAKMHLEGKEVPKDDILYDYIAKDEKMSEILKEHTRLLAEAREAEAKKNDSLPKYDSPNFPKITQGNAFWWAHQRGQMGEGENVTMLAGEAFSKLREGGMPRAVLEMNISRLLDLKGKDLTPTEQKDVPYYTVERKDAFGTIFGRKEAEKHYSNIAERDAYIDKVVAELRDVLAQKAEPIQAPDYSSFIDSGWNTMKSLGRKSKLIKHLDALKNQPVGGDVKVEEQVVSDLMKYTEGFSPKTLSSHPLGAEIVRAITALDNRGYSWKWSANEGLYRITHKDGRGWSNRPSGAPRQPPADTNANVPKTESVVALDDILAQQSDLDARGQEIAKLFSEGKKTPELEQERISILEQMNALHKRKIELQNLDNIDEAFQRESSMKSIANEPELTKRLLADLSEKYPSITAKLVDEVYSKYGEEVLGKAFGLAVEMSKKAGIDNPPHEYAHIYLDILEHTTLVNAMLREIEREGVSRREAKERLATRLGEEYVRRFENKGGKFRAWANRFWTSVKAFFSAKNFNDGIRKVRQERLTRILSARFFAGTNSDSIRLTPKDGFTKIDLEKAIETDAMAKNIVDKLIKNDDRFVLTGSAALAPQGPVYRASNNLLHDIDIALRTRMKDAEAKLYDSFPNAENIYSFPPEPGKWIKTYLIPPEGTRIENLQRVKGRRKIEYYDIIDNQSGERVGMYKLNYRMEGFNIIPMGENKVGTRAVMVDFFSREAGRKAPVEYSSKILGGKLYLSDARDIFDAKSKINKFTAPRDKDIIDWNLFYGQDKTEQYQTKPRSEDERRKRPQSQEEEAMDILRAKLTEIKTPSTEQITDVDSNARIRPVDNSLRGYIRHYYDRTFDGTYGERKQQLDQLTIDFANEADKYIEPLSMKADVEPLAEYLEKRTERPLEPTQKQELYQWLLRQNSTLPVAFAQATTVNGDINVMMLPHGYGKRPMTLTGKDKTQLEPLKVIDDTYRRLVPETPIDEPVYRKLDDIVVNTPDGLRSMTMDEFYRYYHEFLPRRLQAVEYAETNGNNRGLSVADFEKYYVEPLNNIYTKIHEQFDKRGMYYFGGKGDTHTWFMTKYHPLLDKMYDTTSRGLIKASDAKVIENAFVDLEKINPDFPKEITRKGFLSNLLYDYSMNGFEFETDAQGRFTEQTKTELMNFLKPAGERKGNWIKDAVAFNKRMQIWFSGGIPTPKNLVGTQQGYEVDDIIDDKLNYAIIKDNGEDFKKRRFHGTDALNYEETSDGAIVMRDDVLNAMNKALGFPDGMGFNKSFITSPDSKLGALLGKYGIHPAGAEQSAQMKKLGLHMYMPKSAAKQYGYRQVADISTGEFGEMIITGETYQLPLSDIRHTITEVNTDHMLAKQRFAKQLMTNLIPGSASPVSEDVISDIFNTLSGERYRGEEAWNTRLDKLVSEPANEKEYRAILDNLDKISMESLFETIRKPGMEKFGADVYRKIMKLAEEATEEMYLDNEIGADELAQVKHEVKEFQGVYDRLMRISKDSDGIGQMAVRMHKFVDKYASTATRNWLVNELAKPKLDNSFTSRMIPYDLYLRLDDNIKLDVDTYYLSNAYKSKRIRVKHPKTGELQKPITMEEAFKLMQTSTGLTRKMYADALNTLMMRVPMDSLSGARVLKFGGWTNREGYGVLLHPEVMRALGGADLDGDKAFGYMGLKPEWLEAYRSNQDEFLRYMKEEGNESITPDEYKKLDSEERKEWHPITTDAKQVRLSGGPNDGKTLEEIMTIQATPAQKEKMKSKAYMYSPAWRQQISLNATKGRAQLGPNVVTKAIMGAWHSGLAGKESIIERPGRDSNGDEYMERFVITPREDLSYAREIGRGAIAFGSDPLDVIGLVSNDKFFRLYFDAHFSLERLGENGKRTPIAREAILKSQSDLSPGEKLPFKMYELKDMGYSSYAQINSALYGKNWKTGRAYDYSEVKALLAPVATGQINANTMIPKIGNVIGSLNYKDEIFTRIDPNKYQALIEEHEGNLNNYIKLQEAYGRKTLAVPLKNQLRAVLKGRLYDDSSARALARSEEDFLKVAKQIGQKTAYGTDRKIDLDYEGRLARIRSWVIQAKDYLPSDLTDLTSIKRLTDLYEKLDNHDKFIQLIEKADSVKSKYAFDSKEITKPNANDIADAETATALGLETDLQSKSATKNRIQLDAELNQWAKDNNLSDIEREVLETALLNSLQPKTDNTALYTFGYNSTFVSDATVKKFMKEYQNFFRDISNVPDELREVNRRTEEALNSDEISDGDTTIKGKVTEAPIADYDTFRVIAENAKKLPEGFKESSLVQNELDKFNELVNHYGGSLKGKKLSLLVRGLLGKDLSTINLEDLRVLNRFFGKMRDGTWFQKVFDPTQKDWGGTLGELQKRYYQMFPEAVNADMMRRGFEVSQQEGAFMTKEGWKIGQVGKPTFYLKSLQETFQRTYDLSSGEENKAEALYDQRMNEIAGVAGDDYFKLHQMAVAEMEMGVYERMLRERFETGEDIKSVKMKLREYPDKLKQAMKDANWEVTKEKIYHKGGKKLTGVDMVNEIKQAYKEHNARMYKVMNNNMKNMKKYELGAYTDSSIMRYDYVQFSKDMLKRIRNGEDISMEFSSDGLAMMIQSQHLDRALATGNDAYIKAAFEYVREATGNIGIDSYFPHLSHEKAQAKKSLEVQREAIMNDTTKTDVEKQKELVRIYMKYEEIVGDWMDMTTVMDADLHEGVLQAIKEKRDITDALARFESSPRAGSSYSRKSHLAGWSTAPDAYKSYQRNVISTYYRQLSHILSRHIIDRFDSTYGDQDNAAQWSMFFRMYTQNALGYPTLIPDAVYENPDLKIKGTPYGWLADNRIANLVNKIYDKLGIPKGKGLPVELQGYDWRHIRSFSNMEAKYEMATLLAHPKSTMANMMSGHAHSIANAGLRPFRLANDIKYLATINNEWKSMDDVHKWVLEKGVLPEFIMYEAGLGKKTTSDEINRFISDVTKKITHNPEMSDESIRSLAKKYGITDTMFEKAAWFMRAPERRLRMRSFLAHYIQAYETYGGSTMKDPLNSPMLLELAKKGVKATQFLYNAPFRPMYATTAMGKVLTRFQLWGWNSVRFRKDIIKDADTFGYKEGTVQFDRFKRLMMLDTITLALANIFAYSLFETSLPAPWNWFQDTADWLFGDENERKRAFYGTYPGPLAPLQMISPPILRLGPPLMDGLFSGDWEKMAGYQVYTIFPFGRMIRDVVGPNNLIENPYNTILKLTGIPEMQIYREVKKRIGTKEE